MIFLKKKVSNAKSSSYCDSNSVVTDKHSFLSSRSIKSPNSSKPLQLISRNNTVETCSCTMCEDICKCHMNNFINKSCLIDFNKNPQLQHSSNNQVEESLQVEKMGKNRDLKEILTSNINNDLSNKMIYMWDVTDPSQWNLQRVTSWLKANKFNDTWITFFKKNQIYGNDFLKLLAHDNFIKYRNRLQSTKTSSYNRFQYLLKQTLGENVNNGHTKLQKRKCNASRSSSESYKGYKYPSYFSGHTIDRLRSASESVLSNRKLFDCIHDEKNMCKKAHQKTKSAGSLYRRSVISIRRSYSNNTYKSHNMCLSNLKRKPSAVKSLLENDTSLKLTEAPKTIVNSSEKQYLIKTLDKGSSSESSIFNLLFENYNEHSAKESQYHHKSNEAILKKKSQTLSESPLLNMDILTNEKSEQENYKSFIDPLPDNKPNLISIDNLVSSDKGSTTENNSVKCKLFMDKKYYPFNKKHFKGKYILVTKDNKLFKPVDVHNIETLNELKDMIVKTLEINHKNYTIHLTDFDHEIGYPIPDDTLEMIRANMFLDIIPKFYISDLGESLYNLEQNKNSFKLKDNSASFNSKYSLKFDTDSVDDSNGDTYSFSDASSLDVNKNVTSRTIYPQTPNYYYDSQFTNSNTNLDYWNSKEVNPAHSPEVKIYKGGLDSNFSFSYDSSSQKNEDIGFKVIRKNNSCEIDFNKRRKSPYIKSELTPKREAPKPPVHNSNMTLNSLSTSQSMINTKIASTASSKVPKKELDIYMKNKARPPPPVSFIYPPSTETQPFKNYQQENMNDSVVPSYIPGSSQVLVPQPYKGAYDINKVRKCSDDIIKNSTLYCIRNQMLNRSVSTSSKFCPSPQLLTRGNSKRIVSSVMAADVFHENEISFENAPTLSESDNEGNNSDSSDNIIWSNKKVNKYSDNYITDKTFNEAEFSSSKIDDDDDDVIINPNDNDINFSRKMTLRPSPEVVYQNLEKYFPDTDLDKPIVEGLTPPPSPLSHGKVMNGKLNINTNEKNSCTNSIQGNLLKVISLRKSDSQESISQERALKLPKRAKTIRIIAHEASEARKTSGFKKLKRKNTKMWGTKVIEVTDKRMVSINKTKNSNGEYKEFAWIKGDMIGKGSFGAVYLGLNVTTGEMMAVKQVEVTKYNCQDEATTSMVEALRSEVSTLKDLDHLNIVQYLGFEKKTNIYSLFLEYVAGGSVGSLIRMYGRFDEQLIRFLTIQVLRGLSYLHSRNMLHRDMKADNLLLDHDGVCKISDFGISKRSNNIYTNSDMTMRGTVFWMAPEMVDTAHGYSAKVDIWSLGCVVLEMFAGKRPWSNFEVVAAMFKIGKSKSAPPIPEDTLPLISKDGRQFLDACFEIDPDKRPTAEKLLSHPFCKISNDFLFQQTDLSKFIISNDKLNNSKLRLG